MWWREGDVGWAFIHKNAADFTTWQCCKWGVLQRYLQCKWHIKVRSAGEVCWLDVQAFTCNDRSWHAFAFAPSWTSTWGSIVKGPRGFLRTGKKLEGGSFAFITKTSTFFHQQPSNQRQQTAAPVHARGSTIISDNRCSRDTFHLSIVAARTTTMLPEGSVLVQSWHETVASLQRYSLQRKY